MTAGIPARSPPERLPNAHPGAKARAMNGGAILVGDAGGTNVRFAQARLDGGSVRLSDVWKRPGADFATFEAAIGAYLSASKPKLAGASFGLAGAVQAGRVELLHRGWTVDAAALKSALDLDRVVMVNDFFAMARSAPALGPDSLKEISPGQSDPSGSIAVGGPGTGFGVGLLRRYSGGWIVVGGEGGHQVYAPQTDLEFKFAERLREAVGYVSNEVVASGSGFSASLEALAQVMGVASRKLSQAEVIEQAKAGDALALEFCRLRARTVMTAMGDMALVCNATGGVFIAGGVSLRLEPWLRENPALERFYSRGPRIELMRPIPINLILSEQAPLTGAAMLWLDEEGRGWV
jgi:glucokinase